VIRVALYVKHTVPHGSPGILTTRSAATTPGMNIMEFLWILISVFKFQ